MSNNKVFSDLEAICEPFKGILLDAYGVFWSGNAAGLIPGAKEAMARLVASGKIVGILSNSTQLPHKEMDKVKKHGLIQGEHFHFYATSGEIAKKLFEEGKLPFETPNKTFCLSAEPHPKFSSHMPLFEGSSFSESPSCDQADFIYLTIPHIDGEDQIEPHHFKEQVKKLKETNLPVVCTNPDRFAHEGNPPRAVVRQGTLAAMYEEMGGNVHYIGKPSPTAYAFAMEYFIKHSILDPSDVVMVGDTPETDIRGAKLFGMKSALITQTGIMADRIEGMGLEIAQNELPTSDYPDYFIERLGK